VRKPKSQGAPTKKAEAITPAIMEVLNGSLESISEPFVSEADMQKVIATAHHCRLLRMGTTYSMSLLLLLLCFV
jgi:hypothetical protein